LSAIINSDDYFVVRVHSRAGAYGALAPNAIMAMIKHFFSLSTPGVPAMRKAVLGRQGS
jgi:hypothetical protein